MLVNDGLIIKAIDIVLDPSAPDAFVEGLMEGVIQWDTSDPDVMLAESFKNEIKKASTYNLTEAKLNVFANI